jgi:hypothetical protein
MIGGEFTSGREHGGASPAQGGGGKYRGKRSRRNGKSKRRGYHKKGGEGVIATAAVPFGLLALQRYFKGSKTSKRGMRKMGRSFKRTFRRRR